MQQANYHIKYKGLNRGYINDSFSSFSELDLSFWFDMRLYFVSCGLVSMGIERVILQDLWILSYPDECINMANRCQIFQTILFLLKNA